MATETAQGSFDFRVRGLDCAEEVAILNRELGPLVGGEERLQFDVLRGRMRVLEAPESVSPEEVREAVARTGMRAEPWRGDGEGIGAESFWARHGRTVLTTASGVLTAAGFAAHAAATGNLLPALAGEGTVPWTVRLLYLAAILAGAWHVLPRAWGAARRLRPDMHLLMTVAIAGAVGLGEWLEAATVAFLFALSQLLESWSVGRARRAVEALLDLSPTVARVRRGEGSDGTEETVRAEDVPAGTLVVVKPGEKIPLDGVVVSGASEVDQSPITGESLPVSKDPDDEVFAGTINGGGALEIRTTRPAEETTLAHIVRLVEEAQARRSPSERWVDRFARVYTPAVMGLAAAVMVLPPVALTLAGAGGQWAEWFYRGLVLLVIGCPCALVISTPVSIVAALASAARHGVLIKGGVFVEAPAGLEAIAFDKTGTLTRGAPRVVEVVPFDGESADAVLRTAAALEARSEHPLARAILEHAEERGVPVAPATAVRALPGRGVVGTVGEPSRRRSVWIGSHRDLLDRLGAGGGRAEIPAEVERRLERLSATGHTAVVVGETDGEETSILGLIALADGLRPGVRGVIDALHQRGLAHLIMLTGDNEPTARAIAAEAGIDHVRAELLPEDKLTAVDELVTRYGRVAMVGDGVNDAPAMGRSGLGIAMGAAGTDAAIETADVALMADDLERLPWLVDHSRRALRIIRQNIGFALGVKVAVFLLATVGLASLWAAIAADMGASLLVITNALRLLRA